MSPPFRPAVPELPSFDTHSPGRCRAYCSPPCWCRQKRVKPSSLSQPSSYTSISMKGLHWAASRVAPDSISMANNANREGVFILNLISVAPTLMGGSAVDHHASLDSRLNVLVDLADPVRRQYLPDVGKRPSDKGAFLRLQAGESARSAGGLKGAGDLIRLQRGNLQELSQAPPARLSSAATTQVARSAEPAPALSAWDARRKRQRRARRRDRRRSFRDSSNRQPGLEGLEAAPGLRTANELVGPEEFHNSG